MLDPNKHGVFNKEGYMMNFIKKIRWMNLLLWIGLMTISFTIWYWIIKLVFKIIVMYN